MELRRALLLFAIVLGLAAIMTSLSRPPERAEREGDSRGGRGAALDRGRPTAKPRPGSGAARVSFSAAKPRARQLEADRPATVTVTVPRPGQVELEGLGLSRPAEPLTPARFELYERRAGSHDVRFIPAGSGEARSAGTLRIVRLGR